MALIKGVGRVQGIMVQKGNPLDIQGIVDLKGCRYINRQRGAGTRLLFDYELKRSNISPDQIVGYDREAATHMAVAAAVQSGSADAGMGILSAAKAMGLDFIPVADEEYDFALPAEILELEQICDFRTILQDIRFRSKLEQLGGYTFSRCGEVELIEG